MDLSHDHSRTIIHIDIDCFYAQVEMIKDPTKASVPLAVKQKTIIVTSNYLARDYGLLKGMSILEARKLCPNLVIVNGEDLHDYRQMSYKITEYLQTISPKVERLGLDENYIDVTEMVNRKLNSDFDSVVGNVFGEDSENCLCGCYNRIKIGSIIAQELRESIYDRFKMTTCAGVAHNKLLAKLVGSKHRPNQQTCIFPDSALELVSSLGAVEALTGVGRTTVEKLDSINIRTVEDLQKSSEKLLISTFGQEKAAFLHGISHGVDTSTVKISGKPVSIGLEDSLYQNHYTAETQVRTKLDQLLRRLMLLVSEDGRIPRTVKLTVRKQLAQTNHNNNVQHKTTLLSLRNGSSTSTTPLAATWGSVHGVRETRQCAISPGLFTMKEGGAVCLKDAHAHGKVLGLVMGLFTKVVDVKKEFHVTLLGLSFTKFQERGRLSTPSLLFRSMNSSNLMNPSLVASHSLPPCPPSTASSPPLSPLTRRPSRSVSPLRSFFTRTGGPVEVQSLTNIENKSPSDEMGQQQSSSGETASISSYCATSLMMDCTTGSNSSNTSEQCGFNTDGSESEVEPPSPKRTKFIGIIAKRRCGTTITNPGDDCPSPSKLRVAELRLNSRDSECGDSTSSTENLSNVPNVPCPPSADVTVFQELPSHVQRELWEEYKRTRDRAEETTTFRTGPILKKPKVNSILNYLVRH